MLFNKLISCALIASLLSTTTTPAITFNPRSSSLVIGGIAGLVIGAWIGHNAKKTIPATKNPTGFKETIKEFIARHPMLFYGTLGTAFGAASGYGMSTLLQALQRKSPADIYRDQLLQEIHAEIQVKKKQYAKRFANNTLNQDLLNKINGYLDLSLQLAQMQLPNGSTVADLQKTKQMFTITMENGLQAIASKQPHPFYTHETLKTADCFSCMEIKNNTRSNYCFCCVSENKHPWCLDCINAWVPTNSRCPQCNEPINKV